MLVVLDSSRVQRRLKSPFEEQAAPWTPPSLLLSHCPSIRMASICDHKCGAKYHIQNAMSPLGTKRTLPSVLLLSAFDRFCCRTSLRGDANRDSVYLRGPSAERFDDGAAQG